MRGEKVHGVRNPDATGGARKTPRVLGGGAAAVLGSPRGPAPTSHSLSPPRVMTANLLRGVAAQESDRRRSPRPGLNGGRGPLRSFFGATTYKVDHQPSRGRVEAGASAAPLLASPTSA